MRHIHLCLASGCQTFQNLEAKSGLDDIEFGELLRLDSIGTRPNTRRGLTYISTPSVTDPPDATMHI